MPTLQQSGLELVAVYLFGSRARGDQREGSDADLAVLSKSKLTPEMQFELRAKLETVLHAPVDLIDLRAASTVFRVEILRAAVLLFEGDRDARQLFEATALSAYARLNEERKEILRDIRARGRVYAR